MTDYKAGVCNINSLERKKRLVMGGAGFLNAAIITIILAVFPSFTLLYAAIFLLNLAGFLGYFQYRSHFCTGLALRKKFKVGDETAEISDKEKINEDRKKAAKILAQSAVSSGLLTAVIYLAIANI